MLLILKRQEGVEIKAQAQGGLQLNRNTKIGKKASSPVYPDLCITNYKGKYR